MTPLIHHTGIVHYCRAEHAELAEASRAKREFPPQITHSFIEFAEIIHEPE